MSIKDEIKNDIELATKFWKAPIKSIKRIPFQIKIAFLLYLIGFFLLYELNTSTIWNISYVGAGLFLVFKTIDYYNKGK